MREIDIVTEIRRLIKFQSRACLFYGDSCVILFSVCTFLSYMFMCFLSRFHYAIFFMLKWVYNGSEFILICYVPFLLSIRKIIPLKLIVDSSLIDPKLMDYYYLFLITRKPALWLWRSRYPSSVKIRFQNHCLYLLSYMTPCPMNTYFNHNHC